MKCCKQYQSCACQPNNNSCANTNQTSSNMINSCQQTQTSTHTNQNSYACCNTSMPTPPPCPQPCYNPCTPPPRPQPCYNPCTPPPCPQCCKSYPIYPYPYNPTPQPCVPGGYTDFRALTAADTLVFQTAIANLVGVTYQPIGVRTQIVNGTNYTFLALATLTTGTTTNSYYVLINVYQALDGTITLGTITPISR